MNCVTVFETWITQADPAKPMQGREPVFRVIADVNCDVTVFAEEGHPVVFIRSEAFWPGEDDDPHHIEIKMDYETLIGFAAYAKAAIEVAAKLKLDLAEHKEPIGDDVTKSREEDE